MSKKHVKKQIVIVSDGNRTSISINGNVLRQVSKVEFHHDSTADYGSPTLSVDIDLKELLNLIKK